MQRLTTFEDIFNKLVKDFEGHAVQVESKQNGITITSLSTIIDSIYIQPVKKSLKKTKKMGVLVIQEKSKKNRIKIPFILGFHTMEAVFLKKGVIIKSLNREFTIKKQSSWQKRLA